MEDNHDITKEGKEFLDKVLKRVNDNFQKYGENYTLANIPDEYEEELLDIVGWPLLMAIRIQRRTLKQLGEMQEEHLKKFVQMQKTEYLKQIVRMCVTELDKRK